MIQFKAEVGDVAMKGRGNDRYGRVVLIVPATHMAEALRLVTLGNVVKFTAEATDGEV